MTKHPSTAEIHLRGVRVHNLKNIDVDLPLGKLIVISGVSGAGKSSLAFDTLYAEAQRRYLQSFSAYTRQFLERLDKPDADEIGSLPPAIAVGRVLPHGPRATVGTMTEIVDYLRLLFARLGAVVCLKCSQEVHAQQADDVIAVIDQLPQGTRYAVAFPSGPEPQTDPADWAAALREEGFLRLQIGSAQVRLDEKELPDLGDQQNIHVLVDRLEVGKSPRERLADSVETAFARGQGRLAILSENRELHFDQRLLCANCNIEYPAPEPRLFSFNDPLGACPTCAGTGIDPKTKHACSTCKGTRLNDQALSVRFSGKTIAVLCAMSAGELAMFLSNLEQALRQNPAGKLLLDQIAGRLDYLNSLELGYLPLDRASATLSTGEAQRLRLTAVLGANLVNALYILDEPSAGLHPRDTAKLLAVLQRLPDAGNTVVLVEHDPEIFRAADYQIDLGPGAGEEGGEIVYQGPSAGVVECEASVTGAYLAGRRFIGVPSKRRERNHGGIRLAGARLHNLQNLTVEFPLGVLCVVTGVSGAGKSSLVQHTLYPGLCQRKNKKLPPGINVPDVEVQGAGQIGDVVLMDQTPLARTARSSPATYLKIFDEIRRVFADTSEARIRNFGPGTFSFNQPGGRCDACEGQGTLTVDMQFLADVSMTCPDCKGTRFKPEILNVKVRNLNIAEVLDLTVREAFRFFRAQPVIERRLKLLLDVGLDYLRLGQSADTLSGGECQRLKLAGHLASSKKPRCLFILSEPTIGLHTADVVRLLDCLDRLLATGHSLIVIEHDLDVIKCADYVIDLGPEGGPKGGKVVALGTPEEIAGVTESFTGQWLAKVLEKP
jgi:excinuclease ABC subunit A